MAFSFSKRFSALCVVGLALAVVLHIDENAVYEAVKTRCPRMPQEGSIIAADY